MTDTEIIFVILAAPLLLSALGIIIFLYFYGSTKRYSVPKEVHEAVLSQKALKSEDEVRIMSSNLLVSFPSWHGDPSKLSYQICSRPRAKIYCDVLENYAPDAVGIQEMCPMWYSCLLRNKLGYKIVYPASSFFRTRMTAIIYNKNTTKLLKKGRLFYSPKDDKRMRYVVWGLFEDKRTDKKYIVTSTHLSLIRDDKKACLKMMEIQAKELVELSNKLKEKYNVPIFHTGDYNSVNNIENWAELYPWYSETEIAKLNPETHMVNHAPSVYTYLEKNFEDAKLKADIFDAVCDTTFETPLYDHIFLNNPVPVSRFTVISNPVMYQMSDHYSIFADAKIK